MAIRNNNNIKKEQYVCILPSEMGFIECRVKRLIVAYGNTGTVTRTSLKGYATQKDALDITNSRRTGSKTTGDGVKIYHLPFMADLRAAKIIIVVRLGMRATRKMVGISV